MVTCVFSRICCRLLRCAHNYVHVPVTLLLTFLLRKGIMMPTTKQPSSSSSVDRTVLLLLRRKGAHTIEDLTMLTGIGWGQIFLSVDRLSRTGTVSLTPVYPSEYRVSLPDRFTLARMMHDGSSRNRAVASRDGHAEP